MSLTPNPLVMAVHMTGGEEKPKLTTDRPRVGSMRMRHQDNFLSYSLVQGIGLGGLELVIGRRRNGGSALSTVVGGHTSELEQIKTRWP